MAGSVGVDPGQRWRLALGGDLMLGRLVAERLKGMAPEQVWGGLLPLLRSADALAVNLECVIATGGTPWQPARKAFHFRSGPEAIGVLQAGGVSLVSLANNHVLDYGQDALVECLERLERAAVPYAGAGRDEREARRPALAPLRGLTLGMVAFTDNEPAWAAGPARPGVSHVPIDPDHPSFALVEQALTEARRGADLLLASFHWGPNMVRRPPPRFRTYAQRVIEAGADIFHGHSSHLFQGVARHRGGLILYDCGDLVDDYAVDPWERNDLQFLFLVEGSGTRLERLRMQPLRLTVARVDPASGWETRWLQARMLELCAELGTQAARRGSELVVELSEPAPPGGQPC